MSLRIEDLANISILRSQEDICQYRKLLFDIYCVRLKWFDIKEFSENVFSDKYDKSSFFLGIRKGKKMVGGMRFVCSSDLGFPHENYLKYILPRVCRKLDESLIEKLSDIDRSEIIEITRAISSGNIKGAMTNNFTKTVYHFSLNNNIKAFYIMVDINFFLLLTRVHIPLIPIDIPVFCEGSWCIPSIFFRDDMYYSVKKNNPRLFEYMISSSGVINGLMI